MNLYSSSLGVACAVEGLTGKKLPYVWLTITLGCIGTILSVLGILEEFVTFLTFLGILFPLIIGVMLIDYYIIHTNRKILDSSRQTGELTSLTSIPLVGWNAIISCLLGSVVGATTDVGIPSLNSLLSASITYWILCTFFKKNKSIIVQINIR